MPLTQSASKPAIAGNIVEMMNAGHPRDQAIAAALNTARKVKAHKADGGTVDEHYRSGYDAQKAGITIGKNPHPQSDPKWGSWRYGWANARGGRLDRDGQLASVKKAHGGATSSVRLHTGPIHSAVAGRTDHLPMNVPHGAYVLPADIVSGMGQGNTMAGFKVAKQLPSMFSVSFYGQSKPGGGAPYGATGLPYYGPSPQKAAGGGLGRPEHDAKDVGDAHGVPIVAAGGEHVYHPREVRQIGGGDLDRGHRILDKFVTEYREHLRRTLRDLPGPKRN